jgi:hypothetical protein
MKGKCKHCRDNVLCKIYERICDGNGEEMFNCPYYEEQEGV